MSVRKRNEYEIEVAGYLIEDWLNEIIEKSHEGYRIVEGSVVAFSTSKVAVMTKEAFKETPVQVVTEEVTEVDTAEETLDMELIESFDGDKNLLEEYGKDFGIDLKKNKKFENMLSDLIDHVGG